jgi:hypothetical protein
MVKLVLEFVSSQGLQEKNEVGRWYAYGVHASGGSIDFKQF